MTRTREPPRSPQHTPSSSVQAGPLDLGAVARQAVLSFLQDASIATAERQATQQMAGALTDAASAVAATENTGSSGAQGTGQNPSLTAESSAWRAAAISVDTLDRIEAAAARVEADIAAASQAHAEMRAGAGAAVEEAVRAAETAAAAAGTAVQAERRAGVVLRRIEHYTTITVAILIIAIIILSVSATSAH
jgi:hypothetical protein